MAWLVSAAAFLSSVPGLPAAAETLRFDRLALAEGLSQASANDILEDSQGFLWIATQEGLNRWDGYSFEVLRRDAANEASLADNFVVRMWLAPDGTIWAFHPSGQALSLLDPQRRTVRRLLHDPKDPATLSAASQFNTNAIIDELGRVWLGTFDAGIDIIDPVTLRVQRLRHDADDPQSLAADRVNSLLRTADGTIWIATQNGLQRRQPVGPAGEERFDTFRHASEDPSTLPDDIVFSLVSDPDGRIWMGSNSGFASLDPVTGRFTRFFSGDDHPGRRVGPAGAPAFAFLGPIDRQGRLWIGHRAGLSAYDRATGEMRHYEVDPSDPQSLSSRFIQDFHEDVNGTLWIATRGGGINRYSPEIDGFDVFVHDPADPRSLSNDLVQRIYESPSGMLWFGTYAGGASSYSPSKHKFELFGRDPRNPASLVDEAVFSLFVDREQTLWVGTQQGGLHRYSADRRTVIERYFNDPGSIRDLGSDYVQVIYQDRAGRLWIGTGGGGLALIDPAAGRVVRRYTNDPADETSIAGDGINGILEDSQGTFWVSTGAGLDIFDRDNGTFEHLQHDPERPDTSLPRAMVRSVFEDRSGAIWLATAAGLCSLDRASREVTCRRHDPDDPTSLSHDSVMAIHQDEAGVLWLATYGGGLNRFDSATGTFSSITTRDGLPNDNLYSVVPDGQGHLWLSSNHGLVRFAPASGEIVAYDVEDGLQSNEFNDRAYFASDDGELFFGGIHGFNVFRPETLHPSAFVPPVVLTAFRKLAPGSEPVRDLAGLERVVIGHRDLGFSIEFAALDFATPKSNRYAYRLDGFDAEWVESDNRHFASYTNLDGGSYTFRVRGTNADGVWNEVGATLQVVVVPPPWKTWWAYCLYGLALIGAVFGYVRFKTLAQRRELERHREEAERLRQIDRMKDEFLANTSHELRTPLNGIIGITESVLDGATGEVSQTTRENLAMVASSGRRLAHLVDDILDFSKLKNHEIVLREQAVSLRQLVDVTLSLSRGLLGNRQIELLNEIPADLPPAAADEDRVQQILYNLIGNAIKFTREGTVRVSASVAGERVRVAVSDTGVGIPADKLDKIFESFQQADASSAREFGGTGLGLTVSRQLVELHGGAIDVESVVGQGSTFTFSLPLWQGAVDQAAQQEARTPPLATIRDFAPRSTPASAPEPGTGAVIQARAQARHPDAIPSERHQELTVLCVDDEPVNLQVLENILRFEGYTVRRANDGLECLEILRSGFLPNLILLDVMMPRMTGFEVARRIREDFAAPRLPILMVTAKNQVTDLVEGLAAGANDYLSKPFSKPELLARVRTHLNLSRAVTIEAENQRKGEEMKQARAIQLSLLPKAPPALPGLDIAAHLETATEIGGDYYDFFPQQDGSLYVVAGDATGHGISAGMMVSMTKSALKALDVSSPELLLAQLNRVMRAVDLTRMHMALAVAYFTGDEVRFSSAAMPPAIHYRAASGRAAEVLLPGLPLGAMRDSRYALARLDFLPGDSLVLLSDGLPERLDLPAGPSGYDAVRETVARHGTGSAQSLVDALVSMVGHGDGPLADDVTIVVVKRR